MRSESMTAKEQKSGGEVPFGNGVIVIRYHAAARAVTSQKRLYAAAGNTTSNAIPEGNLIYWMWERLPFTGLGGEVGPPGGEAPARDG